MCYELAHFLTMQILIFKADGSPIIHSAPQGPYLLSDQIVIHVPSKPSMLFSSQKSFYSQTNISHGD